MIAFEPNLIEVRHVESGELQQAIPAANLRCLNADPELLHCIMDTVSDTQQFFKLQARGPERDSETRLDLGQGDFVR